MLKKSLAMLVLAVVAITSSYAIDMSVGAGGTFGIGSGQITFDDNELDDMKVTPTGSIGVFYEVGFIDMFALQLDVAFGINSDVKLDGKNIPLGVEEDIDGNVIDIIKGDATIEYSWNSIDLALFAKGRFLDQMLYVMVGPTVQIIAGDIDYDYDGPDGKYSESASASDMNFNSAIIGLAAEVGASIPLGPGSIEAGLRTQWNFTKAVDDSGLEVSNHKPIALKVAYKFTFM